MRVAILALIGLLLTATGASSAAEPIKIGVTGPLTGGSSPLGISMRDGIALAADQINARGGVLGRPLQLIQADDRSDEQTGTRIAREMIERHGVVALVGHCNTGVALASQYHFQEARIPVITAVATGTLVTRQFLPPRYPDNYVFRISANDTIQAEMIVREAVDQRRFARLAILHDTTNYGQLGRADLERALGQRGIRPVAVGRFNLRQADMTPLLEAARAAQAQAILTYGIGPELAKIANDMAKLGWRVPLIGSWSLSMSNFVDSAGPNAEGVRMPQTFIPDPGNPRHQAFLSAYRARAGSERIPVPSAAAQGYDALLILAAAIEQAGSTSGPRIREALEDLRAPVEGVIATYRRPFSRDDHEAITADMTVFGEIRSGRVVAASGRDAAARPGGARGTTVR
jgi:branched-chain amino acid transport system substrate-binding protein